MPCEGIIKSKSKAGDGNHASREVISSGYRRKQVWGKERQIMSLKNFHWGWAKQRFGIWGVRDYYAFLDQMAKEGAKITFGYILVVLASALLATAGLLIDSPAIIIGAMCVAPFLGPSRALCIGGLFGEWRVFWRGLFKQIFGLLFVGSVTAYLITILLRDTVAGVEITKEILLRAMPAEKDVVLAILTAVGAGAAASLALSADPRIVAKPWGQIIDAMIGVEIAISLIPPACVVGMGFAFNLVWTSAAMPSGCFWST
jgi:uncharacterized hydrophobic protein (TIGR00271 family)